MKKSRINWTLKRFIKEMASNTVSFDYPIQRAGGQWDDLQKSLLIHSVACDYPVPPLYALSQKEIVGAKEKEIYYVLDGKQRLTNLREYILGISSNGKEGEAPRLHEETPTFKIDGEEYNLARHKFDELPDNVKDAILDFTLDIFKIEEAEDDEIEDMFFRLNNGTPLSAQQKAKAKMGADSAIRLQELTKHSLMNDNAVFTQLQKRKADDEVALVQSMMLLDDNFQVGKFGTKEVFEYTTSLREGKEEVFTKLENAMNFLSDTLGTSVEKTLLKKLHMPFVLYASNDALQKGLTTQAFKIWIEDFKEKLVSKTNGVMLNGKENYDAWLYKVGCGAGATKAEKVSDRLTATKQTLIDLYAELEKETKEENKQLELDKKKKEEAKKAKEAKADTKAPKDNAEKPSDASQDKVEVVEGQDKKEDAKGSQEALETK